MKLIIITNGYPSKKKPYFFVFVEKLVKEFAELNIDCYVISPQSITKSLFRSEGFLNKISEVKSSKNYSIKIFRPYYFSFSGFHQFRKIHNYTYRNSILNCIKRNKIEPDLFYCHFWESSIHIINFSEENKIPIVVATGESDIPKFNYLDKPFISKINKFVKSVVCVSSKNMVESISHGLTCESKCTVLPNSVDTSIFFKDKKSRLFMRKKLELNDDDFVVIFVGDFIHRKGSKRLSSAIKKMNDDTIKVIYIGSGPDQPVCDNIIFKNIVENKQLPKFLNASDLFVLPTLSEGSCNAIIEAMSCGLPIVSSDLPFNDEFLEDSNSIRINPLNIDEISSAIKRFQLNKKLRNELAKNSYEKSKKFDIKIRAKNIKNILESTLK